MAENTPKTPSQTTRETAAVKAAATRKTNATKRSTTAKKAAGTRAANRGAAARSTTARKAKASAARGRTSAAKTAADAKNEIKTPLGRATDKVVMVPVGAALIARDEVVATFEDLRSSFGTRAKVKQELNRFERRGSSALKGIERDAKKTRTRVERELRQRRARLEKELKRVDQELKGVTEPVKKNVELAGARIENAYVTGRTAATKASTSVQERIAARI